MKKYASFIKFRFLASLQFRSELLLWVVLDFLPFFILFFIFASMYTSQSEVRGLALHQVVEYYFLASIIQGLTGVHFEERRSEEIRMGKIDFFLIRPFSYLQEIIISDLAGKLFYSVLLLPLNIFFFLVIQHLFNIRLFTSIELITLPAFFVLLLAAYCIQLFIGSMITLLTFWFEGAQGLQHFKWVTITIFSGAMFPLEFMPSWLQAAVNALPFKYLYSVPISIMQGRTMLHMQDIVIIAVSILVLLLSTKLLLQLGIKKYSSVGG